MAEAVRRASVPWTLVRLKVRLQRRSVSARGLGAFGFAVSLLVALIVGGAVAAALAASARAPLAHDVVLPIAATLVWLAWSLLPLMTFGTDESLDPARLALLPLRRRPLIAGLAMGALVGPAPAGVLVACIGVLIGYCGGAAALVGVPAIGLVVALSVVTSRMLAATLAAALTSRKGRDVAVVVVSVLALGLQGLRFLPAQAFDISEAAWRQVAAVASLAPPGLAGRAVVHADDGRLGLALLELLPAVGLLGLFGVWWATALERSLTLPEARATRRVLRGTGLRLFRRRPWARPTPTGAVVARDLILARRDPRRRVGVFNTFLVAAAASVFVVVTADHLDPRVVLAASGSSGLALLVAFNQFGFDGPGLWIDAVTPDPFRAIFTGKNLAVAVQVLPIVLVTALVLAARSGGWAYVPSAVLTAAGSLAAGLAAANLVALRAPTPIAENRNPFGGGGSGQGCATVLVVFAGTAVMGVVLLPAILAVGLAAAANDPLLTLGCATIAFVYGGAVWVGGRQWAIATARRRFPEVVAAVDPRRA